MFDCDCYDNIEETNTRRKDGKEGNFNHRTVVYNFSGTCLQESPSKLFYKYGLALVLKDNSV